MGQGKRRVPVWQFAAVLATVESDLASAGERRVADLSRQSATQAVAVEQAADVQAHDGDLPPGHGVVDFPPYLKEIKDLNLDGAVSIELEYSPEPEKIVEWVAEAYRETAKLMQEAGLRG